MNTQLDLTCKRCTRYLVLDSADYENFTFANAVSLAKERGWTMDGDNFACPKCSNSRKS